MEIIRADQISPGALEGVDTISVTDGIIVTALWQRPEAGSGKQVWIALRELTPETVDPVIERLSQLGFASGLLPARWWDEQ